MTPLRRLLVCAALAPSLALATLSSAITPAAAAAAAGSTAGSGPALEGADPTGEETAGAPVRIQLVLARPNLTTLEVLAGEPDHQPLGSDEIRDRFGPSAATQAAATDFLASSGFSDIAISPDRTMVEASGTAAVVERALGTRLSRYRERSSGREFRSNQLAPTLPAALAGEVVAVNGLSDRAVARHHVLQPAAGLGPAGGYTPAQLKAAYRLDAGALAGTDGTGQTIGLVEFDTFQPAHIAQFDTRYYGSPQGPVIPVAVDGGIPQAPAAGATLCCGGQLEAELDIEVIHAIAPRATVRVYEAPNNDRGELDAFNQMVSDGMKVISTSWGQCEQQKTSGQMSALHQVFLTAAAQGTSVYAATGDAGAYDCRNPADPNDPFNNPLYNTLAVDHPASDPRVIAVGGTSLQLAGDNLTYASEAAWASGRDGGGGGLSGVFDAPGWQAGNGIGSNRRQLPDVSLDAAPATGVSVYTYTSSNPVQEGWTVVGGTSVGAPGWAAFNALYNQGTPGRPLAGAAALYSAASCPGTHSPYHDVVAGNNLYYGAGPGFDLATGWGSMNGAGLASVMQTQSAGSAGPTIQVVSPATGSGTGLGSVEIRGCGFKSTPNVSFGGVYSPQVSWLSPTTLRAQVPAHAPGNVDVTVINPGGAPATLPQAYHYTRAAGHQQLVTNWDGRLEAFVTGQDGQVAHAWEPAPNGSFGGFSPLAGPAGGFISDPAAGLNSDGRIEAFAIGQDGGLWHAWQYAPNAGWTAFSPLGHPGAGALVGVPAVATNGDGRLEVFARTSDGSIQHIWQVTPSGGWGGWADLGRWGTGGFSSDVAAGRNGDGRLEIFAADTTGAILHSWQVVPSGGWTGFSGLPGRVVSGSPGVNTNADGRLEVFAQAADDGSIVHTWQYVPSGSWTGWYSLGGGVNSDVSVARNSDGRLEVFALDAYGSLVHTWQVSPGGGWYGPVSLGQPGEALAGLPQTATNLDGRVQALAPGRNTGTVWQTSQVAAGSGWSNWSALSGRALSY